MYLEPKEIQVNGKMFVIHKIPATVAIEVMARSIGGAIPKAGEFATVEAMMVKTMSYVAIRRPNLPDLFLTSKELIDNHCVDYKTYLTVLEEIRRYNEFFGIAGSLLDFCANLIQMLPVKLAQMLTQSSPVSSTQDSPPSMS